MDRDLGIAGRVVLSGMGGKDKETYSTHLMLHREPILRMVGCFQLQLSNPPEINRDFAPEAYHRYSSQSHSERQLSL